MIKKRNQNVYDKQQGIIERIFYGINSLSYLMNVLKRSNLFCMIYAKIKYCTSLWLIFLMLGCSSHGTPELAGLSPKAQATVIKQYGGTYKIGNPYQIMGRWYYPKEDYSY